MTLPLLHEVRSPTEDAGSEPLEPCDACVLLRIFNVHGTKELIVADGVENSQYGRLCGLQVESQGCYFSDNRRRAGMGQFLFQSREILDELSMDAGLEAGNKDELQAG